MAEKTHKSLHSTFAAPPQRGTKLQGLLNSAGPRAQREAAVDDQQAAPWTPDTDAAPSPAAASSAPEQGSPLQSVAILTAPVDTGKSEQPKTATTSVYLRTKAYRELVDRRQKKFRSYAQSVYDAFAYIRDKARDADKDPTDALAALFDTAAAADPWLMPEPQSAKNAAEPTVEAKIAFTRDERQWVEQRMSDVGATHLSPFLATVLEHYLLQGKN